MDNDNLMDDMSQDMMMPDELENASNMDDFDKYANLDHSNLMMSDQNDAYHNDTYHNDTNLESAKKQEAPKGRMYNILFAAGGTGGHLFPALAVAEQLKKLTDNNINIQFIGTKDRMESKIVPELGYKYHTMPIVGYMGANVKSLLLPWLIFESIVRARAVIKVHNIDAVVAAGAYISYPPGIAANQLRRPLFLMESNVNPGKTNAKLAANAELIFTAFGDSADFFKADLMEKLRPYGNPVRDFILDLPSVFESREKFGLQAQKKTVLIMGGSLGARSINMAVERYIHDFAKLDAQFLWQTGRNYTAPSSLPENIKQLQFIEDMGAAYSCADLVVCRSGATTVAELCVAGKPSVLVPMPSASNNEQEHNAKALQNAGGGILVKDSEISSRLLTIVDDLINDFAKLRTMTDAAIRIGKPDAAERVAKEILSNLEARNQDKTTFKSLDFTV